MNLNPAVQTANYAKYEKRKKVQWTKAVSRSLLDLLPVRRLTGREESFDELPFAAQDKIGEPLIPLAFGHVRFGVKPIREQAQLIS